MASGHIVRPNEYYDSVFLMGVNKRLGENEGVLQTAVLMGSENNKRLLADIGIQGDEIDAAKPNDLIVGVVAESENIVETLLSNLEHYLTVPQVSVGTARFRSIDDAISAAKAANLAVLSIPGEYVFREAQSALEAGLHTFIFSSNVPVDEELKLKQIAADKSLLVMGPDCGTSILGGVGIGFANVVRQGAIGAIGPSGTGLQEFATLVHHAGGGISHAIGTGSRDLSREIGGITTLMALDKLDEDPETEVIAIISKPPDKIVLKDLLHRFESCSKPVVGCFLGIDDVGVELPDEFHLAKIIDDAVELSINLTRGETAAPVDLVESVTSKSVGEIRSSLSPGQRFIRGLFAGGTFCYQSQQILRDAGLELFSNTPIDQSTELAHLEDSRGHTLIDMGNEEYTLGRPHPMIDGTIRARRILSEGRDPEVAVLLLDIVLGYNASSDPVGELLDSIVDAKKYRRSQGEELVVVASICGTEEDPQNLHHQRDLLDGADVIVFDSNAKATRFCSDLVTQYSGG